MPNSPNVTLVPPVAAPVRCGRCCLRCLTLRGISMLVLRLRWRFGGCCRCGGCRGRPSRRRAAALATTAAAARATTTLAAAATVTVATTPRATLVALVRGAQSGLGRLCLASRAAGRRLTLVDPHLHADPAEGGA